MTRSWKSESGPYRYEIGASGLGTRFGGATVAVMAAAWMAFAQAARAQCASSFMGPTNFSTGLGSRSVAMGDLNGDGKPDLAAANFNSNDVSVLLGDGNGLFSAAVNYATGTQSFCVAIADLNGDGKADLVVANYGSNNVSVLLGNGNGSFAAAVNYGAGSQPFSLATGDFNGDGKPDLVVANEGSANVSVFLGVGDGTFQAAVSYGVGTVPHSVAVGDMNGDGRSDLVVGRYASSNNLVILSGNGDGTFQPAVTSSAGGGLLASLAIGELSSDGRLDLAIGTNVGSLLVLLGNGNGTFFAATGYVTSSTQQSVAIGDLNGDGRQDLAVANYGDNNVSILLGNGNGIFAAPVNYGAGSSPQSVAIGDINGDGRPDLALARSSVSVLLNNGVSIGVTQQPIAQSVTQGQNAAFSVTATGAVSYQWRRNGVPLANAGHYSGVTTNTMSITGATISDAGLYDARINSACHAGVLSQPAALSVNRCLGDFNLDGAFNGLDLQDIVDALLAGQTCS